MRAFSPRARTWENPEKRLELGISPRRKFENANLLAENFPLFPCLFYCDICFRWFDREREMSTHRMVHDYSRILERKLFHCHSVKEESLSLFSVSRPKVPRLAVLSRSCTKFWNLSRLGWNFLGQSRPGLVSISRLKVPRLLVSYKILELVSSRSRLRWKFLGQFRLGLVLFASILLSLVLIWLSIF